jgi:hypothetical protein
MTEIGCATNIGPVLAGELTRAGITTLETLREVGYQEAARLIQTVNPDRDCTNSMLALAGAIEGVRWMTLPAETRARITAEAHSLLAE